MHGGKAQDLAEIVVWADQLGTGCGGFVGNGTAAGGTGAGARSSGFPDSNAALVSCAAAEFRVPTILTTVAEKSFFGPMFSEITGALHGQALIDRTSMNTWEDAKVINEVNAIGKKRVVLASLWTSVCIVGPALSALDQGYEVCVIADACGDVSNEAHDRAMDRMVQAGGPADERRAVSPRAAARLGPHRDLRTDHGHCEKVRWRLRPWGHLRQDDVRRF